METYYLKRRSALACADFWLNAAEEANDRIDNLKSVELPHVFWTKTELNKEIGRYIWIMIYCLNRYKIALKRAM